LLAFVLALSVIIAIHEYGHYIVGRMCGIRAEVFSLGFGPVLWARRDRRGTVWQVAALPLGGYVRFAGDADAASGRDAGAMEAAQADADRLRETMHGAPLWARSLTVAAGPVFNFVLSIAIFAGVLIGSGAPVDPLGVGALRPMPLAERGLEPGDRVLKVEGMAMPSREEPAGYAAFIDALPAGPSLEYVVLRDGAEIQVRDAQLLPPLVSALSPQSAALAAGLQAGDVIVSVDGRDVFVFDQLKSAVEGGAGAPLQIGVWRDGARLDLELRPKRVDEPLPEGGFATQWRIGVAGGMSFEPLTERMGLIDAVQGGAAQTGRIISGSLSGLGHMISGAISTCNLSGPIGIARTSGAMASQGAMSFVWFIAVLSTAVGLLNLFPVPVLDGGHLVFFAYEALTGRPPSDRALRVLMGMGLMLVIGLMAFALTNDLFCP
jgi:regulator of sigma E protease